MNFNYSVADEEFRTEFRRWLEQNRQYAVPALGPLADEEEANWEATLHGIESYMKADGLGLHGHASMAGAVAA